MNQQLIDFYINNGPDNQGRTLEVILKWDDDLWEDVHDFIQWVLPTRNPSQYNINAPLVDNETQQFLIRSDVFEDNFLKVTQRFFDFLQIKYIIPKGDNDDSIIEIEIDGPKFWMEEGNHNFKRITRYLESCRLLYSDVLPVVLFESLFKYATYSRISPEIDTKTLWYFYRAAFGKNI